MPNTDLAFTTYELNTLFYGVQSQLHDAFSAMDYVLDSAEGPGTAGDTVASVMHWGKHIGHCRALLAKLADASGIDMSKDEKTRYLQYDAGTIPADVLEAFNRE